MLDLNLHVAGLLDDLAAVQTSIYPRRAYERAARQVMLLPEPLRAGAPLPDVGKTATRVIQEVLATGRSAFVDTAVAASGRAADVDLRRERRTGFMSRAVARLVLADAGVDKQAVGLKDYRGDFQIHSTWSDGQRAIGELAIACIERGYTHIAITDHTAGLSIARGLDAAGMRAQGLEIDAINETTAGRFTVLKGIEANILADGSIDFTPQRAPRTPHSAPRTPHCSVVLVAPHSKLDTDEDQTRRLVKAVSTPGVHILAHPSGRKFGKRPGIRADWTAVFAAAKAHGVAIEIDGDPSRQDLPYALARQAFDAGCLIAIDSDAHDTDELCFAEIGLAHARLAGIPATRVINTWTTKKLTAWLARSTQ